MNLIREKLNDVKKSDVSTYILFLFLVVLVITFYWRTLFLNFVTDDFQHLYNSKALSTTDFINFFTFDHSFKTSNYIFYRPLTTQFYYAILRSIFGLNPFFYHCTALIFHIINTILVYKFAKMFLKGKLFPSMAASIFGLNPSNVMAIGWVAAFQEIGVTFFILISLYTFLLYSKNERFIFWLLSLISFLLALLSKEESIMVPVVLTLMVILFGRAKQILKLIPFYLLLALYLYMHFVQYKFPPSDGYYITLNFQAINNLRWYLWWSLGFPEVFTDFIGSKMTILPQLWMNFPKEAIPVIFLFTSICLSLAFMTISLLRKKILFVINKKFVFFTLFYLFFLIPVLFFTQKYAYRQMISLVGISLIITMTIENFYYCYKKKYT